MHIGQPLVRELGLADRVAEHLKERVLNGTLKCGERLPADRILAEQYGVSRTVIREAARTLVGQGLLETRGGSGTYVRGPDPRAVAQSMTMMLRLHHGVTAIPPELVHEVRRVLEVAIAGLAAERAQPEDIAALEQEFSRWCAAADDRDTYVAADVSFHAALATATHNPLFPVLLDSLSDVMMEVRRLGFGVPGVFESAYGHHQSILQAVRVHDAVAAAKAMKAHLRDSDRILTLGLKMNAVQAGE